MGSNKNITKKQYALAFLTVFILGIVFLVVLISVPYLFFLLLKMFLISLKFGVVFIIAFWIIFIALSWLYKISKYL